MKRILLALLLTVVVLVGGFVSYIAVAPLPSYDPPKLDLQVEATPARLARGRALVTMLCAGCHMDPMTGALTGKLMSDAPPEFGPIYSRNITRHADKGIGKWTDGEIAGLLRTGVARDGRYIPPYMVKLNHASDEDIASVIAFLRSDDPLVAAKAVDPPGVTQPSLLTKLLTRVAFKPLPLPAGPIPEPNNQDLVAFGRYTYIVFDCYPCHSSDFTKINSLQPEKTPDYAAGGNPVLNVDGKVVPSANISPDPEFGIGKWSEAEFTRALRDGFRPDNHVLRYPMLPYSALSDLEVKALYAYLKQIPPQHKAVTRSWDDKPTSSDPGRSLYVSYGCIACHGDAGVGLADLRKASEHYPDDAGLKNWIMNAPRIKPGTQMPAWAGVIKDDDYAPLLAYVRKLGK